MHIWRWVDWKGRNESGEQSKQIDQLEQIQNWVWLSENSKKKTKKNTKIATVIWTNEYFNKSPDRRDWDRIR